MSPGYRRASPRRRPPPESAQEPERDTEGKRRFAMPINSDVTADDLKVFLQEAESLLELLDEDIIRLEQESDDEELLAGIFRAAHTLKGSSGMLGFEQMAGLTHEMEDLLDRVRKGTLAVTPDLVDALLLSLDGLKVLKENLANGEEATLDVGPIVEALKAAGEAGTAQAPADEAAAGVDVAAAAPEVQERLRAVSEEGLVALRVTAQLDPESEWASVRSFQILNELRAQGEVLASSPSEEEIEQERAGHAIEILFVTQSDPEVIRAAAATVTDVQSVTIDTWEMRDPAPADAPEGEDERRLIDLGAEARGKPQKTQLEMAATKIENLQTVRIDVERLDKLMNLVGELVIDRTRVVQISRLLAAEYKEHDQVRALAETSDHVGRVVDELHESMMQVRMLPVGVLFSKFPRLVRDLARSLEKQVSFVIEGEGTEIDRSVIEKIKDPLVHLMRNAVDHGVELPDVRRAAGKAEQATVRLSAQHEQGQIVIRLQDDGKGIDPEVIRDAAVRKGQISQEAAARLSDTEVIDLIFKPGLSTAKETTEVSGRGVGMDVVRRDIESLNGRVQVTSEVGVGTTFALTLPLTLATFGGLLVRSGAYRYAIPLSYVEETVRPEPGTVSTVMSRPMLTRRGTVMPLIEMNRAIGAVRADLPGMSNDGETINREFYAVIVKGGENERPIAIGVDELIDQQEIVVKSLSGLLGRTTGIAGASILGDGQVVLIVDVPTLIKRATQNVQEAGDGERRGAWAPAA